MEPVSKIRQHRQWRLTATANRASLGYIAVLRTHALTTVTVMASASLRIQTRKRTPENAIATLDGRATTARHQTERRQPRHQPPKHLSTHLPRHQPPKHLSTHRPRHQPPKHQLPKHPPLLAVVLAVPTATAVEYATTPPACVSATQVDSRPLAPIVASLRAHTQLSRSMMSMP